MYTNELLEEKYKAQKELAKRAEELSIDYTELIEKEVRELFERNNWKINFAKLDINEINAA
jgi:hypothetical protein